MGQPMNFAHHPQQQQQQQQYYQPNAMNFAGRHMQMGFTTNLPSQPPQQQQQQPQPLQPQHMGFVPPPAPTWDSLNNAFSKPSGQPQQQSQKQSISHLDPLST